MELNRFKQLLESTMGNVKPLIMEQVTTSGQSVNQMVAGPLTFVRDAGGRREYYIYKQGKTEQEAKFYVYYQDNPSNPQQPDKLNLLDKNPFATTDLAVARVEQAKADEKKFEEYGGNEMYGGAYN